MSRPRRKIAIGYVAVVMALAVGCRAQVGGIGAPEAAAGAEAGVVSDASGVVEAAADLLGPDRGNLDAGSDTEPAPAPCRVDRLDPARICDAAGSCPLMFAADIKCYENLPLGGVALVNGTVHLTLSGFVLVELGAERFSARTINEPHNASFLVAGNGPLSLVAFTRSGPTPATQPARIWIQEHDPTTGWGAPKVIATGPRLYLFDAGRDNAGVLHALWTDDFPFWEFNLMPDADEVHARWADGASVRAAHTLWWRNDGHPPTDLGPEPVPSVLAPGGTEPAVLMARGPSATSIVRHERGAPSDPIVASAAKPFLWLRSNPEGTALTLESVSTARGVSGAPERTTSEIDFVGNQGESPVPIWRAGFGWTGCPAIRPTFCPATVTSDCDTGTGLLDSTLAQTDDGAIWVTTLSGTVTWTYPWFFPCNPTMSCNCIQGPSGPTYRPKLQVFRAPNWQAPIVSLTSWSADARLGDLRTATEGTTLAIVTWLDNSHGRILVMNTAP